MAAVNAEDAEYLPSAEAVLIESCRSLADTETAMPSFMLNEARAFLDSFCADCTIHIESDAQPLIQIEQAAFLIERIFSTTKQSLHERSITVTQAFARFCILHKFVALYFGSSQSINDFTTDNKLAFERAIEKIININPEDYNWEYKRFKKQEVEDKTIYK